MSEENRCPQCGAALPAQSSPGLCPGCLLQWGLESQTGEEETGSQPAAADRRPPTPEEIAAYFPDLEILELVGRGGMGVVYKARQKRLDRLVALKILAPKIGQDPAFAKRFAREARAMAMLSHPHVVAVHDFGQADGLYYFLMEFVDGANLRRLLDTGKLAPEEALAIVPQICEALQYAHDHGVVHRDIKPENVLLDKEGRVKIADFGIAKLVGKEANDPTLTGAGQIMGTPQYMAPEQIEHPLQVDHRADIYSLGVVFYQMLTGELPIGRFAPPSKKAQIDVRLDEVVLRALEKEPERRYQQVSEVKTQVESIVTAPTNGSNGAASVPPLRDAEVERARRQVKGPAIGLLVVGILNWVISVPLSLVFLWLGVSYSPPPLSDGPHVASQLDPASLLMVVCLLAILVISSLMIFAALKMKRLQAYWLAVAAGLLAIIISPGNMIGLPIGIWALVVLSQREVREAFTESHRIGTGRTSPPATGREKRVGLAALVLCLAGFALTLLVAAVAGRNWSVWTFLTVIFSVVLVALACGLVGRKSGAGKAVLVISSLGLFAALVFLAVVLYYELSTIHDDFGGWPSIASTRPSEAEAAEPVTPPSVARQAQSVAVTMTEHPEGPWMGRLPNGVAVELLAIGEEERWWQPNGLPLAAAPFPLDEERRSLPPQPGFVRRQFAARISGVPLPRAGTDFTVEPSSGARRWIGHEDIQKVPTRIYFSAIETAVPTAAAKATLRWGLSTGPWEDAAKAVFDAAGRPFGPGSWGDVCNSLKVFGSYHGTELEIPYQPCYELRAVAVLNDGREMLVDFNRRESIERALLFAVKTDQIKQINFQRRPYDWVEFQGVPMQWSETPVRWSSAPPSTCNVAAQPAGPWVARLQDGITAELVGVGEDDRWWRPDGSPLAEAPCRFENAAKPADKSETVRRFFFQLRGLPAQPAGITGEITPGHVACFPDEVLRNAEKKANRRDFLAFEAVVPAGRPTVPALRCGIASGPWFGDDALTSLNPYPSSPSVNLIRPHFINGGVSRSSGHNLSLEGKDSENGAAVVVSEDWFDKFDLRLVATTYDGRAVTGTGLVDHPKNERTLTTIATTFPGLTVKEIKKLEVERRPYQWVCFAYVAVQPKQKSATKTARPD